MENKFAKYIFAKIALITTFSLLLPGLLAASADAKPGDKKSRAEAGGSVFSNTAPITLPNSGNANPYPSTISVSGLTGNVTTVKVTLNGLSHTFPDDLDMVLIGPSGAAFRFWSGITDGEDASNVTITVSDSGATLLPDSGPIAPGTFKPAAYYTPLEFPAPGPGTNFSSATPDGTATFASVFGGTNGNGDWKLFIRDFADGDSGSIAGGWSIEFTTSGGGTPRFDNRLDFFGNQLSDWIVVRNATLANASESGVQNLIWSAVRNENPTPQNSTIFEYPFGLTSDRIPAFGDWTGDGRANVSIWRPTGTSRYWISPSQPGPATNIPWGLSTDVPGAEGDYDGDNKMDPTVVRTEGNSARWLILRSSNNTFTTFLFGNSTGDIFLPGADYTGDGVDNPAVARVDNNQNITWFVGNTSGNLVNSVQWGNFQTDFIVPAGDYDGDGKADFMIWRAFGNPPAATGDWWLLRSSGGVSVIRFGLPSDSTTDRDFALRSGDYDGDGKTDIAVYRSSNNTFYVLRSSNLQVMAQHWGVPGDLPLAQWGTY